MGLNDLSSSITNINIIMKTNKITNLNKIFLIIISLAHWVAMGGVATYFIWGNIKYDKYVLYSFICLIISWILYYDCVASYYEKIIIKDVIDIENMRNPSFDLFCYNNNITILIEIITFVLMIFNFAYVMLRNDIPKMIVFLYITSFTFLNLIFRYSDLLKIYNPK